MRDFHFPNWVNRFTVALIIGGVLVAGYLATCVYASILPGTINIGHQPRQPVPFSHKIHAGTLKLDCRYCHNTVHVSGTAAVPPTSTCGNCHGGNRVKPGTALGVIYPESEALTPVRTSLETGNPVEWLRVHDLPDFVYFNHSVHINRGVSCVSCHGRIDKMEVVTQVEPLSMKWCLDCHRNPTEFIRDPELVTQLDFTPPDGETFASYGATWVEKLDIQPNTSCSTCHR